VHMHAGKGAGEKGKSNHATTPTPAHASPFIELSFFSDLVYASRGSHLLAMPCPTRAARRHRFQSRA
jgi:hypothetical protein